MSSTKSSKGEKQVAVDRRDGQFVVKRDAPRIAAKESFPANRSLKQGELPKR
jgi:hypothetical protein